jgi:hypothetical protein
MSSEENLNEDRSGGSALNVQLCTWVRAFDGHFNISCANETGERANGNFKGKDQGATWEFVFCPYCGNKIDVYNAMLRSAKSAH